MIVGIKTAHFAKPGWAAIDRAVEAGRRANVPVMVDDKIFTNAQRTTEDELLNHLRPGDIHTHMYNDRQMELIDRFTGKVQPWMIEARKRGVLFDVGTWRRKFFVARGDEGHSAGIPARHDQHRSAFVQRLDAAVRYAERHVEDDAARDEPAET